MTHTMPTPSPARAPRCPRLAWLALAASLAACGGGGGDTPPVPSPWDRFSIGGTVSGLAEGSRLVLQNNGGDDLALTANGRFGFATPIPVDHPYAVRVQSQPAGQTCTVVHGSGKVPGAAVDTVQVACAPDRWSGLPEGIWQVGLCDTVRNTNGKRTLWRIARRDAAGLDIATGVTDYTAPQCGGSATQQFAPEFARSAFEADRRETRGTLTAFWGTWTSTNPTGAPMRGFLARSGAHLCWGTDTFLAEFPTLDDVERKVNQSIPLGHCFTQLPG